MFGKKPSMREGVHVFIAIPDSEFQKFAFGVVTGVSGDRIGVNGIVVDPVGLKNKLAQDKAGTRTREVLEHPTSENCILALIYRVEHENFTEEVSIAESKVTIIPPKVYSNLDGWIREELSELLNHVLSLPAGAERDEAKRAVRKKMDMLLDKDLKKNLYSICRSLKILN